MLTFPWDDMKIKTKNTWKLRYVYRKFGITQRFNIEDTKGRSYIRVIEVIKETYGETLWRQQHFSFRILSRRHVFTDLD